MEKVTDFTYTIAIKRGVERLPAGELGRELHGVDVGFDFGGDVMCVKDDGTTVSGYGYKVLIASLIDSVTELSKAAAQQGMSEGAIVEDAINRLIGNLSDAHRQEPTLNRRQRRANAARRRRN